MMKGKKNAGMHLAYSGNTVCSKFHTVAFDLTGLQIY